MAIALAINIAVSRRVIIDNLPHPSPARDSSVPGTRVIGSIREYSFTVMGSRDPTFHVSAPSPGKAIDVVFGLHAKALGWGRDTSRGHPSLSSTEW